MSQDIKLPIVVKKDDNETYMAYCPVFRGCHTFANTQEGLGKNLEEVVGMYFDMYKEGDKNVFEGDNILYLNFDTNGKITSNFSQSLDKNPLKALS